MTDDKLNEIVEDQDSEKTEIRDLKEAELTKDEFQKVKKELSDVRDVKEKYFDLRSVISEEIKALFSDLKDLKESRDDLTTKVQSMKKERDDINTEIKKLIEEVKSLRNVNSERVNTTGLQKEVDKMRYYMETNPLSPEEEKKVMKTIKEKEKIINKSKTAGEAKGKLKDISKKIDDLKEKSNSIHSEVKGIAKTSQEKHETLIGKSKDIKFLKAREKEIHASFTEAKDAYKDKRTAYLENKKFYEAKKTKKEDKEAAAIKKIEQNVEEKIKAGKKITTEDLLAMRK